MKSKTGIINFLFIFIILFLVISIIIFPESSVTAALEAVNIWLFVVIPSFFPFFIGAELLVKSGLVDFIGVVLEPIMYPLFRIPGKGSFVFAMSVTSGYPVGASLVSELRADNSIDRDEAQRLIALSSTSGPLFMIAAVAVGMLKNPLAGTVLSISHYLSALTVGLVFRYYGSYKKTSRNIYKQSYVKRSIKSLVSLKDKKLSSISTLLSRAIESTFKSLFMIGGFIIIYSVIIEILNISNIIPYLSALLDSIIPANLNPDISNSILSGMLELTNGCKDIASLSIKLIWKLCIISFLIGWGGLSVHSQAISFMSKTDISTRIYFLSNIFHGLISSFYTYLLYVYVFKDKLDSVNVYNLPQTSSITGFVYIFRHSLKLGLIAISLLILSSIIMAIYLSIKNYLKR